MDNDTFDSYLNARRDYRLYQQFPDDYYDPTQDLPPGIHASIYRPEPQIEDDPDPNEPEISDNWEPSDDPLHF